jgi:hypothetical protein
MVLLQLPACGGLLPNIYRMLDAALGHGVPVRAGRAVVGDDPDARVRRGSRDVRLAAEGEGGGRYQQGRQEVMPMCTHDLPFRELVQGCPENAVALTFSITRPCDEAKAGRPPRECLLVRRRAKTHHAGRSSATVLTMTSLTVILTIRRHPALCQ